MEAKDTQAFQLGPTVSLHETTEMIRIFLCLLSILPNALHMHGYSDLETGINSCACLQLKCVTWEYKQPRLTIEPSSSTPVQPVSKGHYSVVSHFHMLPYLWCTSFYSLSMDHDRGGGGGGCQTRWPKSNDRNIQIWFKPIHFQAYVYTRVFFTVCVIASRW